MKSQGEGNASLKVGGGSPAVRELAGILYQKLGWIDAAEGPDWVGLPDVDKEIYISATETLILHHELVLDAVRQTTSPTLIESRPAGAEKDEIDVLSLYGIDPLARALHKSMERRDPSNEGDIWEDLTPNAQDFYRGCVSDIMRDDRAILLALEHQNAKAPPVQ